MITVEDQIRLAFRELHLEHEAQWVWEHVKLHSKEFFESQSLAQSIIARRRNGEPLAYILGEWPFLNFNLKVASGVLIPRPETEELADKMVRMVIADSKLSRLPSFKILDLGAGSGALGIGVSDALLTGLSTLRVELHSVERSANAWETLKENLNRLKLRHGPRVTIVEHHSSWNELPETLKDIDLLLGNPPYINDQEWGEDVDNSVKSFEPREALTPEEPTDLQKSLATQIHLSLEELAKLAMGPLLENMEIASRKLCPGGLLGIELGPAQANSFAQRWQVAAQAQFNLRLSLVRDLSSKLRFLIGNHDG